ncbi:MAG TPA: DUF167 domain-containing protein [Candidatus Paceibacterota bacterium]|nr:DUF167 domain-containing protein [Candidatus Paceibacterota bacterium]
MEKISTVQYHEGMYLKVFVTPGAKREQVEEKGDMLAISVREPASGNRANDRVRELVALRFGQPIGKVRILTGHHSRGKMISIGS